jgi:phage recombination protein Bet
VKTASKTIVKAKRLQKNEIELLKRTVAKGVSDDEFALFLWVCKKHKLDPMARQVHAVRRFLQKHHVNEKGIWVSGHQMVIQIGIDGYRALAGRDHPDFGGCDEPEFEFTESQKRIPTLARIRLWKKGLEHPIVGVAYWDEYAPRDLTKAEAFMWNKMPKHMLAKCAEALALRKGYPELADIYTNEEMSQAMDEYTPDGRQITVQAPNRSQSIDDEVERQKNEHAANMKAIEAKNLAKASCATNSKAKEILLANQKASVAQEEIWPKGRRHSTAREPGMEG